MSYQNLLLRMTAMAVVILLSLGCSIFVTPKPPTARPTLPTTRSTLTPASPHQEDRESPQPNLPTTMPTFTPTSPCRILYGQTMEAHDIFVRNCDGTGVRRLTEGNPYSKAASWSPDGQYIVFDALYLDDVRVGYTEIYIMNADGSNKTRLLGPGSAYLPSWSPDGERIVFIDGCDVKTMRPDATDIVLVVARDDLMIHAGDPVMCPFDPKWSPDSQQIVFYADELDAFSAIPPGPYLHRIFIVNADGTGLRSLVDFTSPSPNGAFLADPCWSPDGQQVAYIMRNGAATSFLVNADGSGEPVGINAVPDSWRPWYWPQWGH